MKKWQIRRFIKNNSKAIGLSIGALAIMAFALPAPKAAASISTSGLIAETNRVRVDAGLAPLAENATLARSAQLKAADMASKGYFAHTSPDGKSPWYFVSQAGYKYASAGENLAVNFNDNGAVMSAWLNSPTHRANIVSSKYTEIGIAAVPGTYKGNSVIFIVQHFGRPAAAPAPALTTASAVAPKPAAKKTVPAEVVPTTRQVAGTAKTVAPVQKKKAAPVQPEKSVFVTGIPLVQVAHASTGSVRGAETQKAASALGYILSGFGLLALAGLGYVRRFKRATVSIHD